MRESGEGGIFFHQKNKVSPHKLKVSSQGDLFDTFSGRICIGDFSR